MTYVVTETCIRCKYADCVDVRPLDAFREGPNLRRSGSPSSRRRRRCPMRTTGPRRRASVANSNVEDPLAQQRPAHHLIPPNHVSHHSQGSRT